MIKFLKKIWSDDTTENETNEPKDDTEIKQLERKYKLEIKRLQDMIKDRNRTICKLEKENAALIIENDILKNTHKEEVKVDKGHRLATEIFGG